MKVLGFIQRTSVDLSLFTFRKLYYGLVRPILEFGSVVWSPSYHCYIQQIERVQNKFLRVAAYKSGYRREEYNYQWVRDSLNLPTLESRRTLLDLCFLHKGINAFIDCPQLLSLVSLKVPSRRQSEIFSVPFHLTNYGINEPTTQLVRSPNSLPRQMDIFDSKTTKKCSGGVKISVEESSAVMGTRSDAKCN
ncbi:uncharacterized protein [Diabrotica undecimpunctata]|uniref:uncharacterized protein n=1 Tax=Diabrotica undecimpunctata TaxID=50387 RepID=UPI003B636F8A